MSKLFIVLLIFFTLISSCQLDKKEVSQKSESNDTKTKDKFSSMNLIEKKYARVQNDTVINDTLCKGDYIVTIETIEKESFIKSISENKSKKFERISSSKYEEKFNEFITRINDSTLILYLKSGKKDTIINSKATQVGMGFAYYDYVDYLPKISSHLLHGSYNEISRYFLINDSTGQKDEKSLLSCLTINESNSKLITYWYDNWTFQTGGFSILDIQSGNLVKLCDSGESISKTGDYYWGINDVYWIDEEQIFCKFEMYMIKGNHRKRIKSSFVKLNIFKNYNN